MSKELALIIRLTLAFVLGAIVGLERESAHRPAGFRTHTLVSVGAALVMVLSQSIPGADPARLGAQVVSGVGFLGAGSILREGLTVRGLTTAASLWVVATIGLACGAGFFLGAGFTVFLAFIALGPLSRLEKLLPSARPEHKVVRLELEDLPGRLGLVCQCLGKLGVSIKDIKMEDATLERRLLVWLTLSLPSAVSIQQVITELVGVEGVHGVTGDER
ncbi:MAG: MgtC/SapB family protein [bacterium]|jgi:putative Mg2+ transporter-C (MgtC) family protein